MPALAVDGGAATSILDVSQVARALGLPQAQGADSLDIAHSCAAILSAWLDNVEPLDWGLLTKPTPSRGRSLVNLTVNVFHPFELLPAAWHAGRFDWKPDRDGEREARLAGRADLIAFARGVEREWRRFVAEVGDDLERGDPAVTTFWGELAYSALLASQRWHAAFHYREAVTFLRSEGAPVRDAPAVEELAALSRPGPVFPST